MKIIEWDSDEPCLYSKSFSPKKFNFIGAALTPGEWFIAQSRKKIRYLAFGNLIANDGKGAIWVLEKNDLNKSPIEYLKEKIAEAIDFRKRLGIAKNSRLIYGASDNLPGLIVDCYANCTLVQINTAGLDIYRSDILRFIEESTGDAQVIILDEESQRKFESLPSHVLDQIDFSIKVEENDFKYEIHRSRIQKSGYYYDHRINREKFFNLLSKFDIDKTNMLDLFSYLGAWGLHGLKAGVQSVDLVDQGNLESDILNTMVLNNYEKRFSFYRMDVFKYLSNCKKEYSILVADPPAFSKRSENKNAALLGYKKLVSGCLKVMRRNSIFCLASCTHGVSIQDLEKIVHSQTQKIDRKCRLLEIGINPPDHPIFMLDSEQSYLKMLIYYIM